MVFGMFLSVLVFDPTKSFAKAIASAWAIAIPKWPIFKIVAYLQYLMVFTRFSARSKSNARVEWFLSCF